MKKLLLLLGGLLGIGWMGLKIKPEPFPKFTGKPSSFDTLPLPKTLPLPVFRFYQKIATDDLPMICSAVITARGKIKLGKISFNSRMRFTHDAGHDYRHYIELTWFGQPIVKVNEHYRDGVGYMELPGETLEDLPELNSSGNQALWGEALWFPTLYLSDSRVQWGAIDDSHATLMVPYMFSEDEPEQEFKVTFDPETYLIQKMETMRYRDPDEPRHNWILEPSEWRNFNGMLLPSVATATWEDQGYPWLTVHVDDIVFNADVSQYIMQRGL